jgi:hypothetical protein
MRYWMLGNVLMFVRENEFLQAVKNISEELLEMQSPEGVESQAYRLLEVTYVWRRSVSLREEESSFRQKYLQNQSGAS